MGEVAASVVVGGTRPRVLIENSEYWLRNHGDMAMMQMTIERIRHRWPGARVAVLTDSPMLLRALFGDVEAITVGDADPWGPPTWWENLAEQIGPQLVGPIAIAVLCVRVWLPQKARGARNRLRRAWRVLIGRPEEMVPPPPRVAVTRGSFAAAEAATVIIALGGGYLTDADRAQSNRVFGLMEHAVAHGVPVALVGQGLGPLDDPALRERAAGALGAASVIALREGRRGPALLESLGVSGDRVVVTGDDAIELAYRARTDEVGTDIGVCLRVADYSPVALAAQECVGRVVRTVAAAHDGAIAPLAIAEYQSQDRISTLPLVAGYPKVREMPHKYAHPSAVIERVTACRVVLTGAYHLAVFALSQGIPVVALTSTAYYDDKFYGLAEMFGTGITVVHFDDPDLEAVLTGALTDAWDSAHEVREPLRARAAEQIAASTDTLYGLLDSVAAGHAAMTGRADT